MVQWRRRKHTFQPQQLPDSLCSQPHPYNSLYITNNHHMRHISNRSHMLMCACMSRHHSSCSSLRKHHHQPHRPPDSRIRRSIHHHSLPLLAVAHNRHSRHKHSPCTLSYIPYYIHRSCRITTIRRRHSIHNKHSRFKY